MLQNEHFFGEALGPRGARCPKLLPPPTKKKNKAIFDKTAACVFDLVSREKLPVTIATGYTCVE